MWLWLVSGFAAVAALAALIGLGRLRRRLRDLSESYWELRYEYTRLRSEVSRLEPGRPDETEPTGTAAPPVSYVPLSSIKPGSPKS